MLFVCIILSYQTHMTTFFWGQIVCQFFPLFSHIRTQKSYVTNLKFYVLHSEHEQLYKINSFVLETVAPIDLNFVRYDQIQGVKWVWYSHIELTKRVLHDFET